MNATALTVRTHVGRDLLQSAQLFRHEHAVVWEYVSNGLQYKDPRTKPTVVVKIDPKERRIQISDNGRGMLLADLRHYFQMHGENLDRKQGRPGRGMFGTGKSAAFGIGNVLTLTTVKNGKRSKVRLTRKDIEAKADGDEIPVKILENEISAKGPNGTLVEIDEIVLKTIDITSVIRHIERHIAHWPDASVLVNNHQCEFSEPDIARHVVIDTKGTEHEELLGRTSLTIKVAKAPLEQEFQGIAILARGVWHETTLAGCERKPFAEYLFGMIDVPALATNKSVVSAFDMSRSMKLNPRNEVVAAIIRLIGVNLEIVRKQLEQEDRERRRSEEQKRFQQQGSKIAELINSHFRDWSAKLKNTIAKAGVGKDLLPAKDRSRIDEASVVFGDELPAIILGIEKSIDPGPGPGPDPRPATPKVQLNDDSTENLAKPGATAKPKRRTGGFEVKFDKIGVKEKRAKYDKDTRTIIINLEHPRIALEAESAGGAAAAIENPNFLRLANEIAFTEYAIVLAQELSTVQYFFDPQDALVELRQTIDELSTAFATALSR
jgi:hypothetical protein